MAISQLEKPC